MNRKRTAVVAGYEFRSITAAKAFIIITILGPFLIVSISVVPSMLAQRMDASPEGRRIGIIGTDDATTEVLQRELSQVGIIIEPSRDLEQLQEKMLNDELYGILEIPGPLAEVGSFIYYSKTGTDMTVSETLRAVLGNLAVTLRMDQAGLEAQQIRELSAMPGMTVRRISRAGVEEGQDFFGIMIAAVSFVLLLYMTVLLYGQMIGRSVVVEKTSKTIEILLSSTRPIEIMFGKIVGIGLAGLLQYAVWIGVSLLFILVIGPAFDITLPAGFNAVTLMFLLLFFLAAFFLYAALYAALGAAAEDEQNLGQLAWPMIIFLIIPMIMVSSIVMNPTSAISIALSYFPLTSPVVMFVRVLVSMPRAWELVLCFAILALTIFLTVWGAAKIFRVGILMTGKRFSFKEIAAWLRYD